MAAHLWHLSVGLLLSILIFFQERDIPPKSALEHKTWPNFFQLWQKPSKNQMKFACFLQKVPCFVVLSFRRSVCEREANPTICWWSLSQTWNLAVPTTHTSVAEESTTPPQGWALSCKQYLLNVFQPGKKTPKAYSLNLSSRLWAQSSLQAVPSP